MAKKRKTRQQKKLADLRHNFSHSLVNQITLEAKIPLKPQKELNSLRKYQSLSSSMNVYPYLIKDLSKTGILTATILGFELILFFLLKNHTLLIPGLGY